MSNQALRLTPEDAPVSELNSIAGLQILGLTVNPRSREPLLIVCDGKYVGIRSLKEKTPLARHGLGYFDDEDYGLSADAQKETGFPRSHTPNGAKPKGKGYGTALYSALTIAAYMEDENLASVDVNERGSGICSESQGRSTDADRWWDAAYDRNLTDRVQVGGSDEEEEYERVYPDMDASDLGSYVHLDDDKVISHVHSVEATVDLMREGENFDADVYSYSSLIAHHLCPGFFVPAEYEVVLRNATPEQQLSGLLEVIQEGEIEPLSGFKESLLALDVRGLHRAAVYMLAAFYQQAGFREAERAALYYRWENQLDPESPIRQQQLFASNGEGDLGQVAEARRIVGWSELSELP